MSSSVFKITGVGRQAFFPVALTRHFCYRAGVVASLKMLPKVMAPRRAKMRRQIKLTTRRDLTAAIGQRYQAADRNEKKLILDEFVKLTSYHRKHAIRILSRKRPTHQGRQVGHRTYLEAVKEADRKSTRLSSSHLGI